ncbi:MAG: hypothetical protein KI790_18510, partial [Cyclobacteriaceae bacterium]|nr:hypothetical protein [Cyclobacteriaceae bacterium HetDA_MAG_MS6]
PFFLLCMAIATYIVPVEHQALLGQIKTFAIPAVELTVITLVLFKIRTLIRHYKFLKQSNTDFFSAMTSAAQKSLPRAVAIFLATEVAAFYYGFVSWKKRPLHSNEFSYHRESGSLNLLSVLIFLILAETLVLHLVITIWSDTAAWILTGISIYSGFQLLGMTRSLTKRPHEIREQSIILRHGVLAETTIPKEVIERIVPFSGDITERKEIKTLSPLGSMDSYNVLLTLKSDQILSSLYGGEKTFQYLAFHVDDKEKFMDMLQNAGSVHQSTSAAPDVSSIYL